MYAAIRFVYSAAIATGLLLALAPIASAQPTGFHSAGWKQGVEGYWPARASSQYVESARNYAQEFHNYVVKNPQPDPAVVKEVVTTLTNYLELSKKHLATMKKDFAADKDIVAAVEKLEKELATAVDQHKEMVACCENEKFDKIGAMACCSDLAKQLDTIHAEHAALMRKLSHKHAAQAATK